MGEGVGRDSGCLSPSAPASSASPLCCLPRSSPSSASLCASSSTGAGTRLPASVGGEVPDLEPVLTSPCPPPHLCPRGISADVSRWMPPCLRPVRAPPAAGSSSTVGTGWLGSDSSAGRTSRQVSWNYPPLSHPAASWSAVVCLSLSATPSLPPGPNRRTTRVSICECSCHVRDCCAWCSCGGAPRMRLVSPAVVVQSKRSGSHVSCYGN